MASEESEKDIFKEKERFFSSNIKKIERKILGGSAGAVAEKEVNEPGESLATEQAAEAEAIAELKRLKADPNPPFWVRRGKDFNPELDVSKIPYGEARGLLKRYRELEKKREPEKRN